MIFITLLQLIQYMEVRQNNQVGQVRVRPCPYCTFLTRHRQYTGCSISNPTNSNTRKVNPQWRYIWMISRYHCTILRMEVGKQDAAKQNPQQINCSPPSSQIHCMGSTQMSDVIMISPQFQTTQSCRRSTIMGKETAEEFCRWFSQTQQMSSSRLNKVHEAGMTIIPSRSYSRWYSPIVTNFDLKIQSLKQTTKHSAKNSKHAPKTNKVMSSKQQNAGQINPRVNEIAALNPVIHKPRNFTILIRKIRQNNQNSENKKVNPNAYISKLKPHLIHMHIRSPTVKIVNKQIIPHKQHAGQFMGPFREELVQARRL